MIILQLSLRGFEFRLLMFYKVKFLPVSWHFMTDGYTELTETFIKLNCFLHFDLREDGNQQSQTSFQSNTQTLRWNPFLIKVYLSLLQDSYQLASELDNAWEQSIKSGSPIKVDSALRR
jgi:hypothetical protein